MVLIAARVDFRKNLEGSVHVGCLISVSLFCWLKTWVACVVQFGHKSKLSYIHLDKGFHYIALLQFTMQILLIRQKSGLK